MIVLIYKSRNGCTLAGPLYCLVEVVGHKQSFPSREGTLYEVLLIVLYTCKVLIIVKYLFMII